MLAFIKTVGIELRRVQDADFDGLSDDLMFIFTEEFSVLHDAIEELAHHGSFVLPMTKRLKEVKTMERGSANEEAFGCYFTYVFMMLCSSPCFRRSKLIGSTIHIDTMLINNMHRFVSMQFDVMSTDARDRQKMYDAITVDLASKEIVEELRGYARDNDWLALVVRCTGDADLQHIPKELATRLEISEEIKNVIEAMARQAKEMRDERKKTT